jgi:hypothetical protein
MNSAVYGLQTLGVLGKYLLQRSGLKQFRIFQKP